MKTLRGEGVLGVGGLGDYTPLNTVSGHMTGIQAPYPPHPYPPLRVFMIEHPDSVVKVSRLKDLGEVVSMRQNRSSQCHGLEHEPAWRLNSKAPIFGHESFEIFLV